MHVSFPPTKSVSASTLGLLSGAGAPTSGPAGTGFDAAVRPLLYFNTTPGAAIPVYVNNGAAGNPQWYAVLLGDLAP